MTEEQANCPVEGKTLVGTIDLTPTWRQVVQLLIVGLTEGNATARQMATEELYRMADLADAYVADRELLKDFAEVDSPPRQSRRDA